MGFCQRELKIDIIEESMKLKLEIPLKGNYHIPLCDELEQEMTL